MSASFTLTLDTQTSVEASINGGKADTESSTVTLELVLDADAALVKVWGTINPLDPANAGFGETEEGAEWIPAASSFLVHTTTNPGQKTLHVLVRDDVDNEAQDEASITLQGEGPPIPPPPRPSQAPSPAGGPPHPEHRPERRRISSIIRVGRVRDHASLECRPNANRIRVRAPRVSAGILVAHHIVPVQVQTLVETSVSARLAGMQSAFVVHPRVSSQVARRDGEDFLAVLDSLGIL